MSEPVPEREVLERTIERERRARAEAEQLLESKATDLYVANTRLTELAASLAARERYATAILDAAQDGIIVIDGTGRIEAANPAAARLLGYEVDALISQDVSGLLDLESVVHRTVGDFMAALDRRRTHDGVATTASGEPLHVRISIGRMESDEFPNELRRILVLHDLTEERAAADALRRTSFQDLLTGLGNRAALVDQFESCDGADSAVVAIDLNRFRRINDSLGRPVGDEVLRIVADRLRSEPTDAALRGLTTWLPGRIGADEFAVVIRGQLDDDVLLTAVEHVRTIIETPIQVEGFTIPLETCVGYARVEASPEDADATAIESALDRAVIALEHTRRRIGQRVSAYEPTMGTERARVLAVEERIRRGLERGEFIAHYQPRIDVATGLIVAGEALVRWDSPERGLLLPGAFLPIAEQSSLIIAVGETMFEHVLGLQSACAADGHVRPVSINLSNHEFALPSVVDRMERMAADAGVPTSLIEVELQESVIMDDLEYSTWMLQRFAERGFLIALDDFGTGHSSLGRLRSLPIDVLKLDRSFVGAVPEDRQSTEILTAMVRLAEAVGATVVVEGVESESQLQVVQAAGECEVQGFYFSPAVAPLRYCELLTTQPWQTTS